MDRGRVTPPGDQSLISRREALRAGALTGAALALSPAAASAARADHAITAAAARRPAAITYDFNRGWRFGGIYASGSEERGYPDGRWPRVTLPHTVIPLSWGGWSAQAWEKVWIYRKHFSGAKLRGGRVFIDFDGVMTDATVYLNGIEVGQHQGGFLPWSVELTDQLVGGENLLAVVVDGRWLMVPPDKDSGRPMDIDYMVPPGIYRDVRLRVVPDAFVADVFAKPTDVLSGKPGLVVQTTIDSAAALPGRQRLTVELLEGRRVIAHHAVHVRIDQGTTTATVHLRNLHGITLWSTTRPKLYTVRATLSGKTIRSHSLTVTTGFRQATFKVDGFYLNGKRLQVVGLNRHQLFPYTGMAAPQRLQARDAELIKNELNCNMVRCSHYPQSPHFLDACDRIGLMVWEEPPGWQYIGDPHFEALILQNVRDMVVRDRNRPSVIVWGTRLDETWNNYEQLYAECRALAYRYDGSRQTTGALDIQSLTGWAEDVYAYDDYHTDRSGNAILEPPITTVPYLISEAVGSLSGPPLYRWIDTSQTLQAQARLHAQVHNAARSNPAYTGLLAWCAVDYDSLSGGNRIWENIKWGGVLDTFRVTKPGAAFYRSQVSPATRPVILPAFYWDFGPQSPPTGPGESAMIATNCDQLQIYLNDVPLATVVPDRTNYPYLPHPPAFADLTVSGAGYPTLRIDGYVGGRFVARLQMSSDPATDRLVLALEDASIRGDGTDATRATFRALDAFGNQRPYVTGAVSLSVRGPATIIGQNPFDFQGYGGVGGARIRSQAGRTGTVTITAAHPTLGTASAKLKVTRATAKHL